MDQTVNQQRMLNLRATQRGKPVPATVRLKNPTEFRLIGKKDQDDLIAGQSVMVR